MANLKRLRQTLYADGETFDIFAINNNIKRLAEKITRRNNPDPEIRDPYTPCQRPGLD
jgi:hypothetical protein